jgi:hypothetical protein
MRQLTIESGVDKRLYESLGVVTDEMTLEEVESRCAWLQAIFEGPYSRLEKTWKLHPPERWAYYFLIGEELTEIRLLQQHRKKVHEEWKKPNLIDRHKKRIKKVSVQS